MSALLACAAGGDEPPLWVYRAPDPTLPSYSPARVRLILRLLPHMHPSDSCVPLPPDVERLPQLLGYRAWPKDAECDYYSIKAALHWLAERDAKAELALRLYYCIGMRSGQIGGALGVHRTTAWRWTQDGVELLAWKLGWRDPDKALHPFRDEE